MEFELPLRFDDPAVATAKAAAACVELDLQCEENGVESEQSSDFELIINKQYKSIYILFYIIS